MFSLMKLSVLLEYKRAVRTLPQTDTFTEACIKLSGHAAAIIEQSAGEDIEAVVFVEAFDLHTFA